ncbi:MAG TPA: aminotransferase class IV, partial [Bacteroidia bacterium]|nr:aminotransferase class IV [Bacteroidia bacterium]
MMETTTIKVEKATKSKLTELGTADLPFGKVFTDHMLIAEYEDGQWKSANILPFGNLSISPALASLHYGQAIFEGMKAYKNDAGEVFLFRSLRHYKRLNLSAQRMAMPEIPENIFMDGIKELLKLDAAWVPASEGAALYIRPLYISTESSVGVKISESYKLIIMMSPVGQYYSKPLKVLVETEYTRAVDGGIGFVKAAGNYGRSMYPTKMAKEKGYDQLIWTDFASHKYVEESGTMNLMFVINNKIVTPNIGDTILSG